MSAVNTTWVDPTSATLDKATNDIIDEAMTDAWSSDLNVLGGASGRIVTGVRREWAKGADIASAAALALGTDGNLFKITGTTTITSFTGVPQAGAEVTLWFSGATKVTHGSNIKLIGGLDFYTDADSLLTLVSDGTNMIERCAVNQPVTASSVGRGLRTIASQETSSTMPITDPGSGTPPAATPGGARGKGIGAALMQKCLDFAKQAGYELVYIETFENMYEAIKLYERSAFGYIDGPLGQTGHVSCDRVMLKKL